MSVSPARSATFTNGALRTHSSRSSCREADTRRWPTRHSGHRLEPHIMRAGLSGCLQQPFGRLPLLGSRDRDQRAVGGAREHDLCPQTCAALLAAQSAGHDSRRCVEDRRSSQIERYSMINSNTRNKSPRMQYAVAGLCHFLYGRDMSSSPKRATANASNASAKRLTCELRSL